MSNLIIGTIILSYSVCGIVVVFVCRKELANRLASLDVFLLLGVFLTWPFIVLLSIVIAFSENIHWLSFWGKIEGVMLKDIKFKRETITKDEALINLMDSLNNIKYPSMQDKEEVVEKIESVSMIGFNSDRKR